MRFDRLFRLTEWVMLVTALSFLGATIARRVYDPSAAGYARVMLGGENLFSEIAEHVADWIGPYANAESPDEVLVPAQLENDLREHYHDADLDRQMRHMRWLQRFATSPNVDMKYQRWIAEECPNGVVEDPRACHGRVAARLDAEILALSTMHDRASISRVVSISVFAVSALLLFVLWWIRTRDEWASRTHRDEGPVNPSE